ncbi:MAG: sigma-54-dependent Fis family transcriptional regulator [Betaproteobacteria bacterium]|nr:sigma-54-dependent Fis family transcriptional regulator [Betaproteobacteria bacterium]
MTSSVLLIEDEATLAKNICAYLVRYDYEVRIAGTAEAGLTELDTFKPDIIVLDFNLPGMNGVEALEKIRAIDRQIKVIMITAHGSIDLAVEAMKAGAYHFITKPIALSKLRLVLEKAVHDERRDQALSYYQNKAGDAAAVDNLLGESPAMQAVRHRIRQIIDAEQSLQDSNAPAVLILGETGTGKELVARALHFNGPRRDKPFVEINCASIHQNLLESELFGHERGAFTDARERKYGLFETADGGTLFLDEIGDMDIALQARVLKVIEEKRVRRLGSARDQSVDVRILAATHRRLEKLVRAGKFRSDLYFRLRILQIEVPSLRERDGDALFLARHFLALHGARYDRARMSFDAEAEDMLRAHPWPGNVRELRNIIEQAVLLAPGSVVEGSHLSLCSPVAFLEKDDTEVVEPKKVEFFPSDGVQLATVERELLLRALNHTSWNVTHAARLLGLSRDTLRYRIDKFGLTPPAASPPGSWG